MIEGSIVGRLTVVFGVEFHSNQGISYRADNPELKFLLDIDATGMETNLIHGVLHLVVTLEQPLARTIKGYRMQHKSCYSGYSQ